MNYIIVRQLFGVNPQQGSMGLGNVVQALSNAIYLSDKYERNLSFPDYPFFHKVNLIKSTECSDEDISYKDLFYFTGPNREVEFNVKHLNYRRKEICNRQILPLFKSIHPEGTSEIKDELVIHIRTGDIFIPNNPFKGMTPNPLSYYTYLAKLYDKVLIVCQDRKNPIINNLEQLNNVKIIETQDVEESFKYLISAKYLATSGISTFAYAAALCSNKLETLHVTNNLAEGQLNYEMLFGKCKVEVFNLDFDEYKIIDKWSCTPEQINIILNYKQPYLDVDIYE